MSPERLRELQKKGVETRLKTKRAVQREQRIKQQIVDLRDKGYKMDAIAAELHINVHKVKETLLDREIMSTRVQRFNEGLVACGPQGIDVIKYWLNRNDKTTAMWVLESIGAAGKEQINLTVNQTNNQITLNSDAIEAAKAVAAAMAAGLKSKALPPAEEVIDAVVYDNRGGNEDQRLDREQHDGVAGDTGPVANEVPGPPDSGAGGEGRGANDSGGVDAEIASDSDDEPPSDSLEGAQSGTESLPSRRVEVVGDGSGGGDGQGEPERCGGDDAVRPGGGDVSGGDPALPGGEGPVDVERGTALDKSVPITNEEEENSTNEHKQGSMGIDKSPASADTTGGEGT